jgi:hypothetical protein
MPRLWFTASVVVSLLRKAFDALVTFAGPSWDGSVRRYRPEDHYMAVPARNGGRNIFTTRRR